MNPKLLAIIKREYFQQVKTKAFWISTFLIPMILLLFVVLQVVMSKSLISKGRIAVVDLTGRLYAPLLEEQALSNARDEEEEPKKQSESLPGGKDPKKSAEDMKKAAGKLARIAFEKVDATPETLPALRKTLNERVQKEDLKAYIVLDGVTLEKGKAEWRAQSVKAEIVMRERIAQWLGRAATKERLKDRGVDPKVYEAARVRGELDPHEAKEVESADASKNAGFNLAVSASLFFLIYISIFVYGAFIMRGVLEEKNNRIVEVIVSSVRPTDLMLGKILGIGGVGLTQYLVWGILALLITLPGFLGAIGMAPDGLPSIPLGLIGWFVVFFLAGYFLYASMYAALAAPFNTEQEAQQFVMIPGMMLVLTSTTWFFAFNSPNGSLATFLSLFPFTSPLMMFMRISVQAPPTWQIALCLVLLALSIWGMAWFAGRVYRVGILMYGKKPTLPEIFRWARQAA